MDPDSTEVVHTRRLPVTARRRTAAALVAAGLVAVALAAVLFSRTPESEVAPPPSPAPAVTTTMLSPLPYTLVTPAPVESASPPAADLPASPERASPTAAITPVARTPSPSTPFPAVSALPSPTAAPTPAATPPPAVVPPAPTTPVPTSASVAPSPLEGYLKVLPKPWADVTVDGRVIGQTPLASIPLSPGSHAVILTHPDYQPFTRRVEIRAGETTTLRLDLATEGKRR